MSIFLNQAEDSSRVSLEGAIDIAAAVELKAVFLEALKSRKEICISVEKATDLDVTAVQLLWAAKREAKRLEVGFAFEGQPSEETRGLLASVGLSELAVFD
jgi:anti-anti-sigma regulatory factor